MLLRTPERDVHIFLYFPLSIPLPRPVFRLWSLSQISLIGTVKGLLSYLTWKLTSEPDLVHDSQQQQPEDPTLQLHRPHRGGEGCPHSRWVAAVPNLFGTRDWVHGRQFFHEWEWSSRFQEDSSTLHLLCTLFLLLLHQLHLRSSGIRSQRLGTPDHRRGSLNLRNLPISIFYHGQ